jgi:hypothetical protein
VGDRLLKQLENKPDTSIVKDVSTIVQQPKVEEKVPEKPTATKIDPSTYNSFIKDGVEVVDVKAIEKNKKKLDS